uniref:Uncharacterized protein n=1 Tax=Chromera velia CCMP2878 TaxID=1169474 RepID=A0A0G4FUM6_9ALVE|eukprot:Cvel_18844.t1-p1 / transcript=Cvel_18844.t1 / gene=Cvel_18844 / organism=Chromera_velia_CCMP2878 / gene_product=hypothetical protein / transcript_product=hypothetical protein / location=Cvel_scaffold1584:15888-16631(+) / protein_length=248 / sequence_SO=supercontig / SO=protein_coding / is_pseudo=false
MADELNKRIVEAVGYFDVTQHRESVQAARMCRAVPASDDDEPPSDANDDAVSFISCDDLDNRASFCSLDDFEWEEERSAIIREVGEKAFTVQVGKQVVASGETVAELDSQCTFSIFSRSKVRVINKWPCVFRYVEVFGYRSEAVTTSRGLCCLQYLSPGGEGTVSVVQIGNITDSPEADLLIHAGVVDRFDRTAVVRSAGGKFMRVGLQREFDLQGVYPFRAATVVKALSVSQVAGGVPVCDVLANKQ